MLPKMTTTLGSWSQNFSFDCITKSLENFQVVERKRTIDFRGVIAPLSPRQLEIKPEGQRAWRWLEVHAPACLSLKPDDEVVFKCHRYRVMAVHDWSDYGYYRYEIAEAFTK
jgi:hypothetical protein